MKYGCQSLSADLDIDQNPYERLATHEPTVTLWVQWCHVGLMLLKVKSGSLSVFTLPPMTVYCWEAGDLCPEFFTNRIPNPRRGQGTVRYSRMSSKQAEE